MIQRKYKHFPNDQEGYLRGYRRSVEVPQEIH
jgi:hypothetical protein